MPLPSILKTLRRCLVSYWYVVDGDSMLPTLSNGQFILAEQLSNPDHNPCRGQVIVLRHPELSNHIYMKRIIGLPNECVSVQDGVTYIDDQVLDEPYLPPDTQHSRQGEWWNGPDEYFVMGDNRGNSEDSRRFGPVKKNLIIGLVWLRCWPPRTWGRIE